MEVIETKTQLQFVKHKKRRGILETCIPYIYILPVFLFLFIFLFRPFLLAFVKSFYRYDGMNLNEFIGFKNYYTLFFEDEKFWISLGNTLYFFAWMFICFLSPILVAELIYNLKNAKHQEIFRTLMVIPIVVPMVVTLLVWKFLYYPGIGVFAKMYEFFGATAPNFLGSEALVKPSLVMIGFPWVAGLPLLIIYAALQGIDTSIIEASRIDGCSTLKRVLTIDIPMIMPQLKALLALAIISQLQDYEKIFILTQGGPNNASTVPGMRMYEVAFMDAGNGQYGYSCAMAVVMFMITLLFTIFTLKAKKSK